ncbi:unnamed protein product [Microthlaspi erraticum]|uniref:Uncharacterized protein n=1 Tax=Microthlaspi erraticum TaxID=1685480 RepID=A0A6D2KBG3_9BRAS|nr:unnamed protein product [Microthlaspi erraticum]CAA7049132.1 unnamed protein product [Microthlaspi erraticum]CAA7060261.1 unnamed protein product [Microthlaspi erraticum]
METEDDNWGRSSSKLSEPGNQTFTTPNQKWEDASIKMDMEPPTALELKHGIQERCLPIYLHLIVGRNGGQQLHGSRQDNELVASAAATAHND